MGACSTSKMKQSLRTELRTLKQKRSLTPTPNKQSTQQNSIKQQPKSGTHSFVQIKTETNLVNLTNINYFLVYRNTNFSAFYTLIKKETEENPFIIIQHNMTGLQRIIKTYHASDTQYVSQLIKYQLNHPNLIQQFEIYEDYKKYHVVEENNEKITILNKKSFKNEYDIAFVFNQMVEVIDYLHHAQLIHGNLTLNSFAFLGDKYLKLTDLYNLFMKKQMTFEEQHYMAPECFYSQDFTEERDVWSLGVILYQLLYHDLPFKATTINLLKTEITGTEIYLDQSVSEEANSLLKQLLEKSPDQRIKIQKISDSAWLKKQAIFLKEEQIKDTLLRLQKSKKINILQAYLLKFVINNYPPDKLREIYSVFRSLDLDNDGYFSNQELLSSYSEFVENSHDTTTICKAIFTKVDIDRDGKITFSEFILYAIDRNKLLEEDVLENSFKLLQNKKHVITPEQLATQYSLEKEFFAQLILDCTSKGYLTYKNFKELITLTT